MRGTDTVFAVATGPIRAALAVLRVSGPHAFACLARLTSRPLPDMGQARTRWLVDGSGARIDQALILRFAGPASFTGEDVVEIQCHGGSAVTEAIAAALLATGLCRAAERGEFTRRAFENGRMDLLQAEAVADLIDAETEAQRVQALSSYSGRATELVADWHNEVLQISALLAADFDFADEGDVGSEVAAPVAGRINALAAQLSEVLSEAKASQRVREGVRVALTGPPNAGKSTLLNALAGRDVAIVSPIPGTTRDVLEVRLDLGGVLVTLADTAGLRESEDEIEREGVARARRWAASADIVLQLRAADEPGEATSGMDEMAGQTVISVVSKADKLATGNRQAGNHLVSTLSGEGMSELIEQLGAKATELASSGEVPVVTRARHREALERAIACLKRAEDLLLHAGDSDLAAFEVQDARHHLASLIGEMNVEDILGQIFESFCIGK